MTGPVTAAPRAVRTAGMSVALSVIAGVTDVTSWLLLGGFFSAHVTGNVVVLAADAVTGRAPAPAALLAIPVFLGVAALAAVIAGRMRGGGSATQLWLIGAQAVLLTIAAVLSFVTTASAAPSAPLAVVIGLCAVAAMAAQNAYLHLTPGPTATTAVVTGNLVAAATAGVRVLGSRGSDVKAVQTWRATWPIIVGFVAGCVVGACAATMVGDHAAVVPAALAVAMLVVVIARSKRGA